MTEKAKQGRKLKDLALEDLRKLTPWIEVNLRYSKSVLYAALTEYASEMSREVEEARRRLTEVKTALSESETQLKKMNSAVIEAEESLSQIKGRRTEAEKEVKDLEEKRSDLEGRISSWEQRLEAQGRILKHNGEALASLRWLNQSGVTNQAIVDIHGAMVEYEGDAQGFAGAMRELGGLNAYVEEKKKSLRELEAREGQLKESIGKEQAKLSELEEQTTEIVEACADRLDISLARIDAQAKTLDPRFDALMEKYYSTVDTRAEMLLKRIDEAVEKRNNTLAKMLTSFSGTLNKSLEGIEVLSINVNKAMVGATKLAGLNEIAQMMSGDNVSPRTLILRLYAILQRSSETLKKRGYAKHAEALDEALEAMRKLDGPFDLQ